MSGFTALNVEPEENVEDEIDDTKEIQIEEAFKIYQNALKYHSQGPASYPAAAEAYQELFASEVFKYPEVLTDYSHEQQDEIIVSGPLPIEEEVPLLAGNTADSAANTLPQLVYLAYKSRAQFELDVARHELQQQSQLPGNLSQYYYDYCLKSFRDSASALERDDTDIDLWKKAARIADILSSQRLVRFCLESVVAGDDEDEDEAIDLSGLDEAFASGELKNVISLIQDDLSRLKSDTVHPKEQLMRLLQQSNDPYPFLPGRTKELTYLHHQQHPSFFKIRDLILHPEEHTLQGLGESLLDALTEQDTGENDIGVIAHVRIDLGDTKSDEQMDIDTLDEKPVDHTDLETSGDLEHVKQRASDIVDSPRSLASFHSARDEISQEVASITEEKPVDSAIISALPEQAIEESPELLLEGTVDAETQVNEDPDADPNQKVEVHLPTRKRSSTAAGMDEPESRTKSKRLRARESLLELAAHEEETAQDPNQHNQEQLRIIEDADEIAFTYLNKLLAKVGGKEFGAPTDLRAFVWKNETHISDSVIAGVSHADELQLTDMQQVFLDWNDEKSSAAMSGHGTRDLIGGSGGLALFMRHLKPASFTDNESVAEEEESATYGAIASRINASEATLTGAVMLWLLNLLSTFDKPRGAASSYLNHHWKPEMKQMVIDMLIAADGQIYSSLRNQIGGFDIANPDPIQFGGVQVSQRQSFELIQSIFEIHLDKLISTTGPEHDPENNDHEEQNLRLERWAQLATEAIQTSYLEANTADAGDHLFLRYIWASTAYAGHVTGSDKSHILACLADLKTLIEQAGSPVITLPNNTAMPQVSATAIDQEISRLNTLDFFMGVFDDVDSDPLALILKLEPILEPARAEQQDSENATTIGSSEKVKELKAFLDSGDASLKLFLWRRLQTAYSSISYPPKVVSCLLRSFELIVKELCMTGHTEMDADERRLSMLRWIRDGDELVAKAVKEISDDSTAFESLDESHFQSSLAAVVSMLRLVYAFVLYDDAVRVGKLVAPTLRPSSSKLFDKSRDRLREAFVRLLSLLFFLLKEATVQFPGRFERPADELAEYLRNFHNALGHRQYCKHCNKIFVKLVKSELLALRSDIDYSYDIAQILYDMYQLKFSPGIGDADHGCIPELLRDKTTAMSLVPLIMTYARRFNPKDLIKSDLRITIDKIQTCLGQVKTSPTLSYNKKSISAYLKSAIDPQQVYRSLKGLGDLMTKPVQGDYVKVAASGWYMLLGQMSLAKFKSIKRVNPTGTDDLDTAGTFLRHDLEHDMNNWLGWYRLAQVFDAKIEDNLIWNSTKLNESRNEIAVLERNSINAYTMAIAVAMRIADDTPEAVQQLSDMFADFASRLYASSRPPLNMEAFNTDKHLRHLSSSLDSSMSKIPFVPPFRSYAVWNLAATLLRRRFRPSGKEWLCHYTLGKCLWKMFQSPDNAKVKVPVTIEDVLEAFTEAVEAVPKREKSTDYILEPHYKLVSVLHKLVRKQLLDSGKAVEHLKVTQFSKGAQLSEDEHGNLEWEPFILDVLKKLGHADKSNWHHRITARAAHVIYDDESNIAGALGAKHQFTQQIFTKTMTMQVWKPEHERPGRHYVYTGRYLSFFVQLLEQLSDRANMEQLVRRIRRKTTDFLDHPKIWEETALTYVRMLRRAAKVPDNKERNLFDKITHEDFTKMTEKLEKWTHEDGVTSIYLDVIHDAIELKKLNNSLMKGPAIDDLIGDTYACLYETFVSQLPPEEIVQPVPIPSQGTFFNLTADAAPTGDDRIDRMRLNNILSAQTDGVNNSEQSSVLSTAPVTAVLTTPRATPPVEPARVSTPTKPARVKIISRREVQRKAEAALNRQAIAKNLALSRKTVTDVPQKADQAENGQDPAGDKESNHGEEADLDDSRLSSRRPSITESAKHDEKPDGLSPGNERKSRDAEDESELSEVDDEEVEKDPTSIFPDISSKKRKAAEDSEDDANEDEDDNEEDGVEEDDDEGDDDNQVADDNNDDEEAEDGDGEDNDEDGEEDEENEVEDEQKSMEPDENDRELDQMDVDETPSAETVEIPGSQEPTEPEKESAKMVPNDLPKVIEPKSEPQKEPEKDVRKRRTRASRR